MTLTIYSFDVFDTLLTRWIGNPMQIFRIYAENAVQQGLLDISPNALYQGRVNADRRARLFTNQIEATFSQIYRELANELELNDDLANKLQQLELTIETKYLVPIPQADEMLLQARRSHPHVVFISDMYLPSEFIIARLKQHNFWQEGDRLYVSSEIGKSKGKGDLFTHVLQDLQIKPAQLIHTGNSQRSDVDRPRSLGIKAVHFNDANPNRYEAILQKYDRETQGVSSLWAGISRYARLHITAQNSKQRVLRDIATAVAAPILTTYVIWILQRAKVQKLARLYFLARDGEILLQIAKELAPQIYPEVELRYLYVSRQALRMPGLTVINKAFWEWMFDDTNFFSIDSLLKRMCLNQQDAQPIFEAIGYPLATWQQNLEASERQALRRKLESHQQLQALVLNVAEQKRKILQAYLQQEKLLDGAAFGLIDVGWRGSLQISLENIFALLGTRMPVGFYFAIDKPTGGLKHQGQVQAFFFDLNQSLGMRKEIDYRYVSAMEVFCAGCEGTTLEYMLQADGSVLPKLKHQQNQPALDWGLEFFQKSVLIFVQTLVRRSPDQSALMRSPKLLRESLDQLFLSFNDDITPDEAAAFKDCPFFDDPNELYHFYWAMPLQLKDVYKYAIAQRDDMNVHRNAWYEASLQVSSPSVKALVPLAIAQRKLLKKLKKILVKTNKSAIS